MKILIAVTVTAVVVGTGVWVGLSRYTAHALAAKNYGVEVRTEVGRGDLVEVVSAPGQVEPRTSVQISAKISARINELPFGVGDRVTKGDVDKGIPASVLVKLDASDLAAQLKATEARYNAQKASMDEARVRLTSKQAQIDAEKVVLADAARDLRRQTGLLETNDVSQVTVEAAQMKYDQLKNSLLSSERNLEADNADLNVLKHQLEAAEAEISQAKETLSYAVMSSPIDGTVTSVNAKVGELVVTGTMNNAGTVIIEVADLSRMLVVARVDEAAIAGVKVGQRATARSTAYPGREFVGTVQTVALSKLTSAMAARRNEPSDGIPYYKTEILLDQGTDVLAGVTADIEIETRRHVNVVKVPSQCVLGRNVDELPTELASNPMVDRSRTFVTVVYVVKNGKANVRPVRVGKSDLTHTTIESGLEAGDIVITGPYKVLEALKHDEAVRILGGPATASSTKPATSPASTLPAGG